MQWERLGAKDQDETLAWLQGAPELNVVLIHNIVRFGMEPGDSPFNADYFGRRGAAGLRAVGALYNLGSMFFRADSADTVSGMAGYVAALGHTPFYTAGTRAQAEVLMEELARLIEVTPHRTLSSYMVLKEEVKASHGGFRTRHADLDDIDRLASLQADFELEAFGRNVMDQEAVRNLLAFQVTEGAAVVVEEGGRIVSKAEATVASSFAALVGGVYTLPELRGRGLSTACMSALCEHLLSGVGAVGLNVFEENISARRVYEKVGFEVVEDWLTVEIA